MPGVSTLLITSAVVSAASAGVSAYSQIQEGKQQDKMAKANALQMQLNANTDMENSKVAQLNQAQQTVEDRRKLAFEQARTKAQMSTGGVMLNSVSNTDILVDEAMAGELDIQRSTAEDRLISQNLRTQSLSGSRQAQLTRIEGRNAKKASRWNAGASILAGVAGASSALGQRSMYKEQQSYQQQSLKMARES